MRAFPRLVTTLHVIREPSLKAVKQAMEGDRMVLVLSQTDMSVEEPGTEDLARVGTYSEVLQALPMPDGGMRVVLRVNLEFVPENWKRVLVDSPPSPTTFSNSNRGWPQKTKR